MSRNCKSSFLASIWCVVLAACPGTHAAEKPDIRPAALFQLTNIWTVNLTFESNQWRVLEPGRGPRPPAPPNTRVTQFNYVHASLNFEGQEFKDVGVRYKGNSTFGMAKTTIKRSFKIHLNEFTKNGKLAGVSTINLHNNIADASWMHEELGHQFFRDAGVPAPRSSYARVFVTVPDLYTNKYFGLYSIIENPDNNFAQERFGSKKGAIFKPAGNKLFDYHGDDWTQYNQMYDPKTDLTEEQKHHMIDFCKLVSTAPDEEFAARLSEFLDIGEFARYLAVLVWISNTDSILGGSVHNFVIYEEPKTHRYQFVPWDLDLAFSYPQLNIFLPSSQQNIFQPQRGNNNLFLSRMFQIEAFKKIYLARMSEFTTTIFDPERIHKQVDELAAAIRPAIAEESDTKLARFDKVVAGEPVGPERPDTGRGGSMIPAGAPIKTYATQRADFVKGQLADGADSAIMNFQNLNGPNIAPAAQIPQQLLVPPSEAKR